MKAFTYRSPTREDEAVKLLGAGALPLAGGTNLLNLMKDRVLEPDVLVNLKSIAGLDKIEPAGQGHKIGANVTIAALAADPALAKAYPALTQALATMATPQIRNFATLGGNLCARTPCWYYTHEYFSCPKRGNGNICPAKDGDHEYHAIYATDGACVSVHASSAAPALVALGAAVRIAGPKGGRELPLEHFFVIARGDPKRENLLEPNEIVTHVTLLKAAPRSATYVVSQKASHDWPVAQASVALEMQGDVCKSARICLGAVAPIPWRVQAAEAALAGKKITPETAGAAADAAVAGAQPLANNAYKVKTTRAAVRRAILVAAAGKWS
jgi:xanthine dehydrogenase YagS FAD-binding subunit